MSRSAERDAGSLFDRSLIPTLTIDLERRQVVRANNAAELFLGRPAAEIVGRPAAELLSAPSQDQVLRQRGLQGQPTSVLREVVTSRGPRLTQIWMIPTDDPGIVDVQAVDVSDLVQPDHALDGGGYVRASDLEALLRASPVPAVVVDTVTRRVLRANLAAIALLGQPTNAIVGRDVREIVPGVELDDQAAGAPRPATRSHVQRSDGPAEVDVRVATLAASPLAVVQLVEPATRDATKRRLPRGDRGRVSGSGDVDRARVERVRRASAAVLVLVGLTVFFVGWVGGVDVVTRIRSDLSSMKVNTALGITALGFGLVRPARPGTAAARTIALVAVAALGAATWFEYWAGVDLGIDELLIDDPASASHPGRMGLNTALCFTLLGPGFLLLRSTGSRRRVEIGQLAALVAGSIALLAAFAYIVDATASGRLASATEMALHTALSILLATIVALSTTIDQGFLQSLGSPRAGGRFARRLVPVGIVIVIGSAVVVRGLRGLGVVDSPELALALQATMITALLCVVLIRIAAQSNALDERSEDAQRDLAAVLAAFPDRHFRVAPDESAREVTSGGPARWRPVLEEFPVGTYPLLRASIRRSQEDGGTAEFAFAAPDGRQYEARVAPLPDGDTALSLRDVSELAKARDALAELTHTLEAQVRQRTSELEHSNADLEQFAYLASHDLQEPLRMVSTFVEKLVERLGPDLDETSRQYADFAVDGAQRMADLVDGLLQYSRAGRTALEIGPVDVVGAVEDVTQMLGPLVTDAGGTITCHPDLPVVQGDARLVRQIVQNLLSNALRFAAPDRPPVVTVTGRPVDDDLVELSVTDNGIGVPPEHREDVFQMFRRLHARSAYPGTGIGLSLVRRLVEAQGGTVHLDPEHGPVGTRVVLTLPAFRNRRAQP